MIAADEAAAAWAAPNGSSPPTAPSAHGSEVRRAAAVTFLALVSIYAVTSAPGVTWWDAGEFIAAARTLGIPHPPGTPLYILIANVWSRLAGFIGAAQSVNLLSAVCTAAAGALAAGLVARASGIAAFGVGAALCAGTMSTIWASATEAEVYAPALLLAMLTLWSAERAGRSGEQRFMVLTAYLFALAGPLHVTALIAAPAAIVLAATRADGSVRRETAGLLALALLASAAIGTGRWVLAVISLVALLGLVIVLRRGWALVPVLAIAVSAFFYMLVRAGHDPGINQGNPFTVQALLDVVAREQYTIAGLWPRQAPVWLQVVNFLEYADWQVALGFGPTVTPTPLRTAMSIAFIALGAVGFVMHRRMDRRSWRALLVLIVCGSIGVIAYLNLKAGPSIGYGILPDDAPHEPRERDYFFAFAFWVWGLWAGIGAIGLAARRIRRRATLALASGLVVAVLPAFLNWRAMDRRREPEASLPGRFAAELLNAAPERAVLLVAGDNDSYPLWYLQHVEGVRRDVVVVTYPLLGAGWYRDELHRREGLGTPPPHDAWMGISRELAAIATSAAHRARPLAASVTVERAVRDRIARTWRLTGLVYVAVADSIDPAGRRSSRTGSDVVIDVPAIEASARRLAPMLVGDLRPAIDPTARLMREAVMCPSIALRAPADTLAARLLESVCNSR